MTNFHGGPLLPVQDDLTIEQFILDGQHPTRPRWYEQRPVLIEEDTGREVGANEVSGRSHVIYVMSTPADVLGLGLAAGADTWFGEGAQDTVGHR